MRRLSTDKSGCRHKFEANFCGGGFIVEVLGNLSLALILGTAAAVQDDDDDNFTTLIKDPTKLQRYSKDP